jgi:hypothetical protein
MMDNLPIRVFPVQKEHTYDGILTSIHAVGYGKTVAISQIEGQPLCIDLYGGEVRNIEGIQGRKAIKSLELDQPMPSGDELQMLAARYLSA